MAAITWQNVNGPAPIDWRGAAVIQQGMENAFDKLGAVAKRYDDTNVANWKQGAINNTNEFLTSLNAAKNPMELQALQESGKLAEMQQRFGAQADQPAIRAALDARQGLLQQQESTAREYQKGVLSDKQLPLTNAVSVLTNKGKTADAQAVLDANPELQSAAILQQAITDRLRLTATQGQADTKATDEHDVAVQRVATDKLQGQVHQGNLDIHKQEQAAKERLQHAQAIQSQNATALKGTMYEQGPATESNADEIRTLLDTRGIGDGPDERVHIMRMYNKLVKEGYKATTVDAAGKVDSVTIPYSKSAVIAALNSSTDQWWRFSEGWANDFENRIKGAMNKSEPLLDNEGKPIIRNGQPQMVNPVTRDFRAYQGTLASAMENPVPLGNITKLSGLGAVAAGAQKKTPPPHKK